MFAKDKVTQSMIDAVNKVLDQKVEEEKKPEENQTLSEAESLKIPTSTGTRVYGHRYGNAAQAHKDQTRRSVDDVKEPTKKDIEKDAKLYKKTPPSTAKSYDQFGQHMAKEEVRRSDVPAFIRKAKGEKPLTPAEVKAPKKDTLSHSDNLAKARANEEVVTEGYEEIKVHSKDGKHIGTITHGKYQSVAYAHPTTKFGGSKEPHPDEDSTTLAGPHETQKGIDFIHAHHRMMSEGVIDKVKGLFKKKEKSMNLFDQPHVKKDIKAYLKKSAKQPQGPSVKNIMAKEEVELTEEELDVQINEVLSKDATAGDWIHDFVHSDNPKFAGKSKAERKKMALGAYYAKQNEEKEHDDKGEEAEDKALIKKMVKKDALKEEELDEALKGNQHKIDANHNNKIDGQDFKILRGKKKVQETVDSDNAVTTDTLAGRMPGGKSNSFKSFKLRVKPLDKEGDGEGKVPPCNMPDEDTAAQKSIKVKEEKEPPFDKPYTKSKDNIKDKSGAVHTPMSRARDLARQAFKKIKNETMMGKAGTTSESKKKW